MDVKRISLKVSMGNVVRRVSVDANVSYSVLSQTLNKLFQTAAQFQIRYQDNEEDWITISSDEELQEALYITSKRSSNVLRLALVPANFSFHSSRPPLCQRFARCRRNSTEERTGGFHQSILDKLTSGFKWWTLHEQVLALLKERTRASVEQARELIVEQLSLSPNHPLPLYNLACAEALLGNRVGALSALKKAIESGFDNVTHIENDDDLRSLRGLAQYQALISNLKAEQNKEEEDDDSDPIAEIRFIPLRRENSDQHQSHCHNSGSWGAWRLHHLAMALIESGSRDDLLRARELLVKQASLIPSPIPFYNIACVDALLGNSPSALTNLQKAIELGYRNVSHIESDEDLASLRETDEFQALVQSLKGEPVKPASASSESVATSIPEEPAPVDPEAGFASDSEPAPELESPVPTAPASGDEILELEPTNLSTSDSNILATSDSSILVPVPTAPASEVEIPELDFAPSDSTSDSNILATSNSEVNETLSASERVSHPLLDKIRILEELGFPNRQQNIAAIISHKGDVNAAAQSLLDQVL